MRDNYALAQAGYQDIAPALNLLAAVPGDANPVVAAGAVERWRALYDLASDADKPRIATLARSLWLPRLQQLGFDPLQKESLVKAGVDPEKGLAIFQEGPAAGDGVLVVGARDPVRLGTALGKLAESRLRAPVREEKEAGEAKIVTFARMSAPGSKVSFCSPCLPMPLSPVRTPITLVPSDSTDCPGNPVNRSTPSASTCSASHLVNLFSEMM